ncbi:hypothetical protein Aple_059010 [Acrocarpospora pleiomorpha]|uniref:Secreted protein n=1 Tax=Acrocarpospora pleiomorpha TaxID=90975 RepID=A0A5M3XPS7_9ACTN|nr:hypothetical protein [Acrocarpospora pleiomorpha]GES23002.1 hypothetical protein Aple_059010 [Acrocarpospora pleiomorpha]
MNRTLLGLAAVAIAGIGVALPATSAAAADYGPDTCRQGYVWRGAKPSDLVCVTPGNRDQTALDNSVKHTRWTSGAYGAHTCLTGYVWRDAFDGDDVCVHPRVRSQAAADNAASPGRKVAAKLWISKYTIKPKPGTTTSTDDIPKLKINGSHYNYGQVRLFVRYSANNRVAYSVTLGASAHPGFAGGSFGRKTGLFDCSGPGKPANAYAQAHDLVSGRWSARVPIRIGCAVL